MNYIIKAKSSLGSIVSSFFALRYKEDNGYLNNRLATLKVKLHNETQYEIRMCRTNFIIGWYLDKADCAVAIGDYQVIKLSKTQFELLKIVQPLGEERVQACVDTMQQTPFLQQILYDTIGTPKLLSIMQDAGYTFDSNLLEKLCKAAMCNCTLSFVHVHYSDSKQYQMYLIFENSYMCLALKKIVGNFS